MIKFRLIGRRVNLRIFFLVGADKMQINGVILVQRLERLAFFRFRKA